MLKALTINDAGSNYIMELSSFELKAHYTNLLHLHVKYFGKECIKYEPVLSHGSERLIVRLHSEDGSSSIGIVNRHIDENKAFISFGIHFRNAGLNVPEVYIVSPGIDSYILEDLGDETLLKRLSDGKVFNNVKFLLYKKVIDELPKFQVTAGKEIDYSFCYQYMEFGSENIDFDLEYFKLRFLGSFYKSVLNHKKLSTDLLYIKDKILEFPRDYFLYRDFQSRNIMIKNDVPYFIDFQSGRKGALLYDMASLLYDAKADIPQTMREELLDYYLNSIKDYGIADTDKMHQYFWYFAIVRILQAMGAYGFLGIVKGKRKFLESIPYAIRNINFILENRTNKDELLYLKTIFNELLKESKADNDKA
ncbi:MAG: phosphotransferase [Ignavibacteria bacterium]